MDKNEIRCPIAPGSVTSGTEKFVEQNRLFLEKRDWRIAKGDMWTDPTNHYSLWNTVGVKLDFDVEKMGWRCFKIRGPNKKSEWNELMPEFFYYGDTFIQKDLVMRCISILGKGRWTADIMNSAMMMISPKEYPAFLIIPHERDYVVFMIAPYIVGLTGEKDKPVDPAEQYNLAEGYRPEPPTLEQLLRMSDWSEGGGIIKEMLTDISHTMIWVSVRGSSDIPATTEIVIPEGYIAYHIPVDLGQKQWDDLNIRINNTVLSSELLIQVLKILNPVFSGKKMTEVKIRVHDTFATPAIVTFPKTIYEKGIKEATFLIAHSGGFDGERVMLPTGIVKTLTEKDVAHIKKNDLDPKEFFKLIKGETVKPEQVIKKEEAVPKEADKWERFDKKWKLREGATHVFFEKDGWKFFGDEVHCPKEDIKYNAIRLKDVYDKFAALVKGAFAVSKAHQTNMAYIWTTKKEWTAEEERRYEELWKEDSIQVMHGSVEFVLKDKQTAPIRLFEEPPAKVERVTEEKPRVDESEVDKTVRPPGLKKLLSAMPWKYEVDTRKGKIEVYNFPIPEDEDPKETERWKAWIDQEEEVEKVEFVGPKPVKLKKPKGLTKMHPEKAWKYQVETPRGIIEAYNFRSFVGQDPKEIDRWMDWIDQEEAEEIPLPKKEPVKKPAERPIKETAARIVELEEERREKEILELTKKAVGPSASELEIAVVLKKKALSITARVIPKYRDRWQEDSWVVTDSVNNPPALIKDFVANTMKMRRRKGPAPPEASIGEMRFREAATKWNEFLKELGMSGAVTEWQEPTSEESLSIPQGLCVHHTQKVHDRIHASIASLFGATPEKFYDEKKPSFEEGFDYMVCFDLQKKSKVAPYEIAGGRIKYDDLAEALEGIEQDQMNVQVAVDPEEIA